MLRLADIFAALTILLILAMLGFGAAIQLELFEPGIQVFKKTETGSGIGWVLYAHAGTQARVKLQMASA